MRTTDFEKVGTFYSKDNFITFVSLSEELMLKRDSDFIKASGFQKMDSEISAIFIEKDATLLEMVNIPRGLKYCDVPVFTNGFEFPKLLNIDYREASFMSCTFPKIFPATQVCKALAILNEDETEWETAQRITLVDYQTKLPQFEDDVIIFPRVIKGFKTIYPTSFDTWVKVLLKAREFKTVNKEYLQLKSLFKIK